jgi:hypothetical protein
MTIFRRGRGEVFEIRQFERICESDSPPANLSSSSRGGFEVLTQRESCKRQKRNADENLSLRISILLLAGIKDESWHSKTVSVPSLHNIYKLSNRNSKAE